MASTEAFVQLSGRWCGNEILALTWVEVSKALEALDGSRASERTAIWSLREAKRQISEQQEQIAAARASLQAARSDLSRLQDADARLKSTSSLLETARESVRRRDRFANAAWTQLCFLGAVPPPSPDFTATTPVALSGNDGDGGGARRTAEDVDFDAKEAFILEGLKQLGEEWSERGKAVGALTERLKEVSARRDEDKARLETQVEASRGEAAARGEELARMLVEFEGRAASSEAAMARRVEEVQAEAAADAKARVSAAAEDASRRVSAASEEAFRKAAAATADASRKISEATNRATRTEAAVTDEAARRVSAAEEAVVVATATSAKAAADAGAAVERQRAAEAALRVLGRFVGPLHRLCLELREQKRFLSRAYKRDAPLQAELFTVAAAVTGKDYWCLSCNSTSNADTGRINGIAPTVTSGYSNSILNGGGGCSVTGDDINAFPPDIPPSLRAVVIAVIAANRLTRAARVSAALAAVSGVGRGRGEEAGRRRVGEDTRYMSRAGGTRSLPVLPPWCAARELAMPRAGELEALPDSRALEVVLGRLLLIGSEGGGTGEEARNRHTMGRSGNNGRDQDGEARRGDPGVLNVEGLWGGAEGRVGDLLHHLLRGRKDHMMRVKERGLAMDVGQPPSAQRRQWEGGSSGGAVAAMASKGGWRVRLGRTVRQEMEISLWMGEGPGQPGSLHLRVIRKALAALAREVNASEFKRMEAEGALCTAGGGAGIRGLEKTADALRRRVGLLEAEALSRPDKEAVLTLEEGRRNATSTAEGLRTQVERLEREASAVKEQVSEAAASTARATAELDDAKERARRLEASRLELAGEVEQLKAFAQRANLERDECLERERAATRERRAAAGGVGGGNNGGGGGAGVGYRECGTSSGNLRSKGQQRGTQAFVSGDAGVESPTRCTCHRGELEEHAKWDHEMQQQQREEQQARLTRSQEELRCCRAEEARLRTRCLQMETRLTELRGALEEQKEVTSSMRREATRAHEEADSARKKAEDAVSRLSRQEKEARGAMSVLQARLLETGAKNSRRRDLLQLQACAQDDLQQALRDAIPSATTTTAAAAGAGLDDDADRSLPREESKSRTEMALGLLGADGGGATTTLR